MLVLKAPETILDSTKAGEFPLHLACRNCDASVVEFLLESFPDVVQYRDCDNKFPVDHALERHDVDLEVLNLLLEKHSVSLTLLDDTGRLPLHRLLERNNRRLDEVVSVMTEWCPGALRFQDPYGRTPLLQACEQNNTLSQLYCMVRSWPEQVTTQATVNFYETDFNRELLPSALISRSASLDRVSKWIEFRRDVLLARDSQGRLPLHYAVVSQSRESAQIVQLLLDEAPASASVTDGYGRLPLHYAAATPGCKGSLVKKLIHAYPDSLEQTDQTGRLPWHYADCARNDIIFDRTMELYPNVDTDLDYVPDEIRWDIVQVIPDSWEMDPEKKLNPIMKTTFSQLETFAENVEFLWKQTNVPVFSSPPSPIQFLRDHVQCSRPCIIRNAITDETGVPIRLTLDDIAQRLGPKETMLTVDVTPDGHGDSVRTMSHGSSIFVQPAECEMTIDDFRRRLRGHTTAHDKTNTDINSRPILADSISKVPSVSKEIPDESVVYYSRQNDCLRNEIPDLYKTFPQGIDWAEEALGPEQALDAVNLWVGNERAVSSMHKDHYENLFYVASGEKVFTVCPPADVAFLYEHRQYCSGRFQVNEQNGTWEVCEEDDDTTIPWIAPDVTILQNENRDVLLEEYPLLQYVKPLEILVREGEMLYLPSLWFHRVTQSCETVGVNYWYDMRFDSPLWCYFTFLQQLEHTTEADDAV
ncbi:MAG: hypothetical protein SGBAC_010859 [Bacillariaceae sp.]